MKLQGFIQPPTPQTESTPQARRNYPPQKKKVWYVPEVYKMTKVVEYGRENGKKSVFH